MMEVFINYSTKFLQICIFKDNLILFLNISKHVFMTLHVFFHNAVIDLQL